jgi:hypothetical protein
MPQSTIGGPFAALTELSKEFVALEAQTIAIDNAVKLPVAKANATELLDENESFLMDQADPDVIMSETQTAIKDAGELGGLNLSPSGRREFDAWMQGQGADRIKQARYTGAKRRTDKTRATTDKTLNTLAQQAARAETLGDQAEIMMQVKRLLEAAGLAFSAEEKVARTIKFDNDMNMTRGLGMVRDDPELLREMLKTGQLSVMPMQYARLDELAIKSLERKDNQAEAELVEEQEANESVLRERLRQEQLDRGSINDAFNRREIDGNARDRLSRELTLQERNGVSDPDEYKGLSDRVAVGDPTLTEPEIKSSGLTAPDKQKLLAQFRQNDDRNAKLPSGRPSPYRAGKELLEGRLGVSFVEQRMSWLSGGGGGLTPKQAGALEEYNLVSAKLNPQDFKGHMILAQEIAERNKGPEPINLSLVPVAKPMHDSREALLEAFDTGVIGEALYMQQSALWRTIKGAEKKRAEPDAVTINKPEWWEPFVEKASEFFGTGGGR